MLKGRAVVIVPGRYTQGPLVGIMVFSEPAEFIAVDVVRERKETAGLWPGGERILLRPAIPELPVPVHDLLDLMDIALLPGTHRTVELPPPAPVTRSIQLHNAHVLPRH